MQYQRTEQTDEFYILRLIPLFYFYPTGEFLWW